MKNPQVIFKRLQSKRLTRARKEMHSSVLWMMLLPVFLASCIKQPVYPQDGQYVLKKRWIFPRYAMHFDVFEAVSHARQSFSVGALPTQESMLGLSVDIRHTGGCMALKNGPLGEAPVTLTLLNDLGQTIFQHSALLSEWTWSHHSDSTPEIWETEDCFIYSRTGFFMPEHRVNYRFNAEFGALNIEGVRARWVMQSTVAYSL